MRGDDRIEIGGIARAHGIRGEVVVVTHDPDSTILHNVDAVFVRDRRYVIKAARGTHRGWLVALEGLTTRNDAELLKGAAISVHRDEVPLDEGQVILDDMVGCTVMLQDGSSWGQISEIDVGFQDRLIIVQTTPGSDMAIERMLPLVDQFIVNVDLAAGIIIIDPPDGIPQNPVPASAAVVRRSRPGTPDAS